MLLNLTNHRFSSWQQNQVDAAIVKYQSVEDLAFPQIPPDMTGAALDQLVEKLMADIRKLDPAAVHIMGEMTFTYRMVKALQAIGIPCIASTTERKVTEANGVKTSIFEFVQFREY